MHLKAGIEQKIGETGMVRDFPKPRQYTAKWAGQITVSNPMDFRQPIL